MSLLRWHLIIVDDRNYFALRVWRYVSRTVGIQMENSTNLSAKESAVWPPDGKPLLADEGEVCFWWIEANSHCVARLRAFLQEVPESVGVYVLVDVKGKSDSSYRARDLCDVLKSIKANRSQAGKPFQWKVVSSYPSVEKIGDEVVERKSIDTLRALRQAIYPRPGNSPGKDTVAKHVLVTGAGFEISDRHGGFGMVPTREILENMGPPFWIEGKSRPSGRRSDEFEIGLESYADGFPLPILPPWQKGLRDAFKKRAERGELDLYWDILLEQLLNNQIGQATAELDLRLRDQKKIIALHQEQQAREAFRKSILEHDWGYMNQSLIAAERGWHAWLTTNYTKFADRAIDLQGGLNRDGSPAPWHIISTASEANLSVREDIGSKLASDVGGRYLFKLHGDIAHLHTMAIAGHDKDLVNPLCVPVENLYQIYAAAERYLRNSLWNLKGGMKVVWHVVGHGLQDIRLFRLIQSVCFHSARDVHHTFVLVDPSVSRPREAIEQLFVEGPMQVARDKVDIVACTLKASQYMARVARRGLTWFDFWLSFGPGSEDLAERFKKEFDPEENLGEVPEPPESAQAAADPPAASAIA